MSPHSERSNVLAARIVTVLPTALSGSIAPGRLIGNDDGDSANPQLAVPPLMRSGHPTLFCTLPGRSSIRRIAGKQPTHARSGFYITASVSKRRRHLSSRYENLVASQATHPNYQWTGLFSMRVHSFDLDSTTAILSDGWEANIQLATETGKRLSTR
jgi:hypothetical protein